jgi:hypothetical protein
MTYDHLVQRYEINKEKYENNLYIDWFVIEHNAE